MARIKVRQRDFKDPDEELVKDYDPEANGYDSDGGSDDGSQDGEDAGTEHYVAVGKSRLREREEVALGKSYRGSRVSRQALEEESDDDDEDDESEYDDPETADLEADMGEVGDLEIESDDALAESDEEGLKDFVFRGSSKPKKTTKRATAADYMSSSEEEASGGAELDGSEDEDDEDEDEMSDGLALIDGEASEDDDEADDDDDDEEEEEEEEEGDTEEEEDEEDSPSEDDKQTAKPSLVDSSHQIEVQKGVAIQEQRKIYDGLLNMRIRLQKALVAANTLPTLEDTSASDAGAYEAAEEAAIKLLNTISGLRQNLAPSSATGDKRKRQLQVSASNAEIWERIQEEDGNAVRLRHDRLEKWSRKVQSVNVATAKLGGTKQKTLVSALQEQLNAPQSRLIKRTQVPRSCAPVQAAKKMTESEEIYDDADFYQLLLKELVDQRTVEGSEQQNGGVASVMVTANKEAKMRKVVDRKASKGRKMRFTVHEKLQNFMAAEDRRSWEQEAIDRLFGTLFGQKLQLDEDEKDDEEEDDEMDGLYNQEGGPRLFR